MNSLTKQGKIIVFGGTTAVIAIVAILIFAVDWTDLQMKKEIRETIAEQEIVKAQATEALKGVVDVANRYSGITSGAVFNFEIDNIDGRSANFGIWESDGVVGGDSIVEERMAIFREVGTQTNNTAEVDMATSRVVAMHRSVPSFATGDARPADDLEIIARQFVEKVYPEFTGIESTLEYDPGNKTNPEGTNYFFRWNDKGFALPAGLEMDLNPFVQVGITSSGFIFSYDNTIPLYRNLPKEALRTICGFVDMPPHDDSSLDPEKGEVIIWFNEYDPFQNRYLILPFEPETDFEGCSESAKNWMREHPYLSNPPS